MIISDETVKRIWGKDGSLWKKDPKIQKEIKECLGWLNVIEAMKTHAEHLQKFGEQIKNEGYTSIVLLGMGGSSLCPEVLKQTFEQTQSYPKLWVLDSTDPATILDIEKTVDLEKTLFIVSSKSGGTVETISLFHYFYSKIPKGKNFIAITDQATPLQALATQKHFREIFINPSDIGGRYSALSYFGLAPAALMGLDIRKFLNTAEKMRQACMHPVPENPGAQLGATLGDLYLRGKDKITFVIPPPIQSLGSWLEQLLAESTGKEGKGLVPVDLEPLGAPDVYGNDRVFVSISLRGQEDNALSAQLKTLEAAGHPAIRITLDTLYDLSQEFFRWEFAAAVAGSIMSINAFDQPNVQESKDNTNALLEEFKKKGALPQEPGITGEKEFKTFLQSIQPGDYIALMAYFQQTPRHQEKLLEIRRQLRDRFRTAATLGYGPRFLHSTGQLHKGGANNGVFIQFTADDTEDAAIPGQPYGFSLLKQAQALGDYRALKAHKRRVIRIHLGKNILQGLQQISALLQEMAVTRK